jgi:NUDIX domain
MKTGRRPTLTLPSLRDGSLPLPRTREGGLFSREDRMSEPATPEPTTADLEARRAARRYPERPIVAVLAVVLRPIWQETRALIVQRAQQPNAGRWGFPGGVLELGETVAEGAMRELLEETGIVAEPAGWLNIHDAISRDDEGRVQFH